MPYDFKAIESKWQQYWLANKTFRALEPHEAGGMPKAYVLDMFPYPSGAGLHVGHPEGYTATDIVSRYLRMRGHNVLHPMGWDAFGLPAEQYAIRNNVHPGVTTRQNIENFRRQIQMLGLSYDWDREVDTTDPAYYRWTQWIFLQMFNSYFDPVAKKARPIAHLMQELTNDNYVVAPDGSIHLNPTQEGMEVLGGEVRMERTWKELSPEEQRDAIDGARLAYTAEVPVNWCPALGTVLANEEVIDGKSEIGGFPVERRPMRQWMLRITAYADRLLEDLEKLDWPESLKEMQRNWIGRSEGAEVDFELAEAEGGFGVQGSVGKRLGLRERALRTQHSALRTQDSALRTQSKTPSTSSPSSPPGPIRSTAPPTWYWRPSIPWSTALRPRRIAPPWRSIGGRFPAAANASVWPTPETRPASSRVRTPSTPSTTSASPSGLPTTC